MSIFHHTGGNAYRVVAYRCVTVIIGGDAVIT